MKHAAGKGEFGYIRASRTRALIRTVLILAVCIGFFLFGRLTTGTNRNLFSLVFAVLCLPAGLSAVNMIMFFRARPCSEEAYRAIEMSRGLLPVLYDLTLTGERGDFPIACACAAQDRVLCYTEDPKLPVADAVHHITMQMSIGKYHNLRIEVLKDLDTFCDVLRETNEARAAKNTGTVNGQADLPPQASQTMTEILRSISL